MATLSQIALLYNKTHWGVPEDLIVEAKLNYHPPARYVPITYFTVTLTTKRIDNRTDWELEYYAKFTEVQLFELFAGQINELNQKTKDLRTCVNGMIK